MKMIDKAVLEDQSQAMAGKQWTLGVVENEDRYIDFIKNVYKNDENIKEIRVWTSAETFMKERKSFKPDVMYLDIKLPYMNGVDLAKNLHETDPDIKIIMLTTVASEEMIFKAIRAGALGYILKDELDDLKQVTEQVLAGGAIITPTIAYRVMKSFQESVSKQAEDVKLTVREHQVLEQIMSGLSTKDAAKLLDISSDTLRTHVKNIYKKLRVTNRVELMKRASDLDL